MSKHAVGTTEHLPPVTPENLPLSNEQKMLKQLKRIHEVLDAIHITAIDQLNVLKELRDRRASDANGRKK